MAAEVMELEFLFRPSRKLNVSLSTMLSAPIDKSFRAPRPEPAPFHYNAIHDIESAWWIGLWMLFFHKPRGHSESSRSARIRRDETNQIFSGPLYGAGKLLYLKQPEYFFKSTLEWISDECLDAVEVFEDVRTLLLEVYHNLEKTFPDGLSKLSDKAQVHQNGHHVAFPGGPEADIHKPIQDAFLTAKEKYDSSKTELVRVK